MRVVALAAVLSAGCHCVVEGTLISTPGGPRPVEQLKPGDAVWTLSARDEREIGTIASITEHRADSFVELRLADGSSLRVTAAHPLRTRDGWERAGRIGRDRELRTESGWTRVSGVTTRRAAVRTFDLSVSPNPTFFADGVLAHNKSVVCPPERKEIVGSWIAALWNGTGTYRLELDEDGTGLLATAVGPRAILYRTERWSLSEYTFSAEFTCLDPDFPPVKISGSASPYSIDVTMEGSSSSIRFAPFDHYEKGREAVQRRIDAYRQSHK
jgi:hypothetical protein